MHLAPIELIHEPIEKKKIARRFNKAALAYESASVLQKQVGLTLLSLMQSPLFQPATILDVGGGSGYFSRWLVTHYDRAHVVMMDLAGSMLHMAAQHSCVSPPAWVQADFDRLPFGPNTFDWIYANMSLQWSLHLHHTLVEMHRALANKGWFMFSLPVEGSLWELIKALQKTNHTMATHQFISMKVLAERVQSLAWAHVTIRSEEKIFYYHSAYDLLCSLKYTGANHVQYAQPSHWTKKMLATLENHYPSEPAQAVRKIKATYHIAYVCGKK